VVTYDSPSCPYGLFQEFACNGTVVSSEEADEEGTPEPSNKAKQNFGQVIQLQGDQRAKIREFLISTGMVNERDAKEKIQVYVFFSEMLVAALRYLPGRTLIFFFVISVTVIKDHGTDRSQ
jgi:hypothetical protein